MKKQSNNGKYLYFSAITVLVIVFGLFVLEKSQVTNFYTKSASSEIQGQATRPVNDVQYSPADPTDNDDINKQKEDGTIGNSNNIPISPGAPINVVLTAAGQDNPGGPIIIKVLLTDVSSGTCDVVLSKDDITKNYSASIINAGNYYTCEGFDIPLEDLELGSWNLTVTVTSSDRTGTAEQAIQVSS